MYMSNYKLRCVINTLSEKMIYIPFKYSGDLTTGLSKGVFFKKLKLNMYNSR